MSYDRFYQHIWDLTNDQRLLGESGYISETAWDRKLDLKKLTTPLAKVIKNSVNQEKVSVILYPGCFAPIHEGHIEAMNIAKATIEEQTGEAVAAGYFIPDHDDYVQYKTGDPRFDSFNRIQIAQSVTSVSSWMDVDPWAALHASTALNFTTLYDRFSQYLKEWLPDLEVKVYLVFGEDNLLFQNAFVKHGYSVCILRPGSNPDRTKLLPDEDGRVLFSRATPPSISSSEVRKNAGIALHQVEKVLNREAGNSNYVLRDDLALSLDKTNFPLLQSEILLRLVNIFEQMIPSAVNLKVVNAVSQVESYKVEEPTISLDAFWSGAYNVGISRLFEVSDHQISSTKIVARPGFPPLDEQLRHIPKGSYCLVDDDISTGFTMSTVVELLRAFRVEVYEQRALIENDSDLFDVVDARDFIIGATHGGLTVRTPTGITRVPYVAPFVNLVTRAKLEADKALLFSAQIWMLNLELYQNSGVTVGEIKDQDFTQLGFSSEDTIESVCRFFL